MSTSSSFKTIDDSDHDAFRPIYYLGCKGDFTTEIRDAINDVDPSGGPVCDLFAGTGAKRF